MKYLGKNLCSISKGRIITFMMNHPDFTGVEVYSDKVLVAVGYDQKKDDVIFEDWANKKLDPLFFMQVIFEHEDMF